MASMGRRLAGTRNDCTKSCTSGNARGAFSGSAWATAFVSACRKPPRNAPRSPRETSSKSRLRFARPQRNFKE
eukprot:9622409-Lingulodinium_polyedra.AAC.1